MAKRTGHTCFNCGTPTRISVHTREIPGRRYICNDAKCWTAYHNETAEKRKQ